MKWFKWLSEHNVEINDADLYLTLPFVWQEFEGQADRVLYCEMPCKGTFFHFQIIYDSHKVRLQDLLRSAAKGFRKKLKQ
jgi:hypothetical protein